MRVVTVEAAGSAMGFNFQFWVKSKRDGPRRRRSSSAAWPRWSPWADSEDALHEGGREGRDAQRPGADRHGHGDQGQGDPSPTRDFVMKSVELENEDREETASVSCSLGERMRI